MRLAKVTLLAAKLASDLPKTTKLASDLPKAIYKKVTLTAAMLMSEFLKITYEKVSAAMSLLLYTLLQTLEYQLIDSTSMPTST